MPDYRIPEPEPPEQDDAQWREEYRQWAEELEKLENDDGDE